MKKRWYHVTAVLAAAAIFSGMNGFGREACLAKETVPAGTEGVGAQAAAEPLMYGIGSTSKVVTAAAVMRLGKKISLAVLTKRGQKRKRRPYKGTTDK